MESRIWKGRLGRILAVAGAVLAMGLAFLVVMIASGYFTMRMVQVGRRVTVPDVSGRTLDAAQEALAPLSLFVEVAAERHDERLEEGRILAQEPPAGAPIKKFRKVKVVTSLGPKVFKIPDLRGHLLRSALITLQAEGLRQGRIVHAYTDQAPQGAIFAQDPPPEGESLGHAGVSLLVSKGPRERVYVMPSLKGMPAARAAAGLERRGLRVASVRRELAPWTAPGRVTGQYPEPGHPVSQGDPISLVVSN